MKKEMLIVLFLTFCSTVTFSQKAVPEFDSYHKNIYGEFLGSSLLFGVNYDMRLNKGRMDGIGFRAGIGGFSLSGTDQDVSARAGVVTMPLEFNHLIGKRSSSFVSGVGILPAYASARVESPETSLSFNGVDIIGGFFTLGYRYQPKKTGVMFQVNWNPMILQGSGLNAGWIGLGLGVGFK